MADHGDYLGTFQFEVKFSGLSFGFSKITNLESKIEYDVINEGGNPSPILVPKPKREADTITFEKGMLLSKSLDSWNHIKPGMKVGSIIIYVKDQRDTIKTLSIEEGLVISKEYPLLDALSDSVYVEKLQIAHTGLKDECSTFSQVKVRV